MGPTFWEVFWWSFAVVAGGGLAFMVPVLIAWFAALLILKDTANKVIEKVSDKINDSL